MSSPFWYTPDLQQSQTPLPSILDVLVARTVPNVPTTPTTAPGTPCSRDHCRDIHPDDDVPCLKKHCASYSRPHNPDGSLYICKSRHCVDFDGLHSLRVDHHECSVAHDMPDVAPPIPSCPLIHVPTVGLLPSECELIALIIRSLDHASNNDVPTRRVTDTRLRGSYILRKNLLSRWDGTQYLGIHTFPSSQTQVLLYVILT